MDDGRSYRIFDLVNQKQVTEEPLWRSSTNRACRCLNISFDVNDSNIMYLTVATMSDTVHVFKVLLQ